MASRPAGTDSRRHNGTGTVTKILEKFGLIDDSIFFDLSVVEGPKVNPGDRVSYESVYSDNLAFKWSATVVRLIDHDRGGPPNHPPQQQQQQQPPGGYPPPSSNQGHSFGPPPGGKFGSPFPSHSQQQQQQHPPHNPFGMPPGPQHRPPGPNQPGSDVSKAVAAAAQQFFQPSQGPPPPSNYRASPQQQHGGPPPPPGPPQGPPQYGGHFQNQPGPGFPPMGHGPRFDGPPGPRFDGPPGPRFDGLPPGMRGPPPPGGPRGPPPPGQGYQQRPPWEQEERFDPRTNREPPPNQRGPPPPGNRFDGPPPPRNSRFEPEEFQQRPNFPDFGRGGPPPPEDGRFHPGGDNFPEQKDFNRNRDGRDRRDDKFDKGRGDRRRDQRDDRRNDRKEPPARDNKPKRKDDRSVSPAQSNASSVRSVPAAALPKHRRYDATNIPKESIMRSTISASALRVKLDYNNIHVPSDLKEVFRADDFEFDFLNFPKGVQMKIENQKDADKTSDKTSDKKADTSTESKDSKEEKDDKAPQETKEVENVKEELPENKQQVSDVVITNKYNVKVLLLSIPKLEDVYTKIFGKEFNTANSFKVTYFAKVISVLVTKNSSDGPALIGGRWSQEKDGFLAGTTNPDLVATAIRITKEQCSMDLSDSPKWRTFSTFVYNLDTKTDASNYEITKILMPDISFLLDRKPLQPNGTQVTVEEETTAESKVEETPSTTEESQASETVKEEVVEEKEQEQEAAENSQTSNFDKESLEKLMETLNELKVADLKKELEKFDIHQPKGKKDALVQMLKEKVEEQLKSFEETESQPKDVEMAEEEVKEEDKEDEAVEAKEDEKTEEKEEKQSIKRKAEEEEKSEEKPTENKKVKLEPEVQDDSVCLKGNQLSFVSLWALLAPKKADQFELVVVADFLRNALTLHFARYIYSTLIFKPNLSMKKSELDKIKSVAVNFQHLAFTFFDRNASGTIPLDDIQKIFDSTGIFISKKLFNHFHSVYGDKVHYQFFHDPQEISASLREKSYKDDFSSSSGTSSAIIERNSIQYNVEQLVEQFESQQKSQENLRVSRVKIAELEKKLEETMNSLEKMRSMEKQFEEFGNLKRKCEKYKSVHDSLKKTMAEMDKI